MISGKIANALDPQLERKMNHTQANHSLSASCALEIPFNDLDPAGVVWHGRYFKYFELARARLMEDIGYGYEKMHDSEYTWPVVDARVRYLKPLKLNQQVTVTAVLKEWELRLKVDHEIVDGSGAVFARATTIQVPVRRDTNELQLSCPAGLVERVEARLAANRAP